MMQPSLQTDQGENFQGALPPLFALQPVVHHRQLDILRGGRAGKEIEALEDKADFAIAYVGPFVRGKGADILPLEEVSAARRPVQTAHDIHQGGLA